MSALNLLMLVGHLALAAAQTKDSCPPGLFLGEDRVCYDFDECEVDEDYPEVGPCGENAVCQNTEGSFTCQCEDGYRTRAGTQTFSAEIVSGCFDINECSEDTELCGDNATCSNISPHYSCYCDPGFLSSTRVETFRQSDNVTCVDEDECRDHDTCGGNATCANTLGSYRCTCDPGFALKSGGSSFSGTGEQCEDIDECSENADLCGDNATCSNLSPHYSCCCDPGFLSSTGVEIFCQSDNVTCVDVDECSDRDACGGNATCANTLGGYRCTCDPGFALKSGGSSFSGTGERCEDVCSIDEAICGNGTCHLRPGGHLCACHGGFTNYGSQGDKCITLDCDVFNVDRTNEEFPTARGFSEVLKTSCQKLSEAGVSSPVDGYDLLERLLSIADALLSGGILENNRKVSAFLAMMESALGLVSPLIAPPGDHRPSNLAELTVRVHRGSFPYGPVTLSANRTKLGIHMETAAGPPSSYPGFATVSMLSYANLERSADGYFSAMEPQKGLVRKINSKVVTVGVSSRNTSQLEQPVTLTFDHLEQGGLYHNCVFWDASVEGGSWSPRGCSVLESSAGRTVCSCSHLSSFAVLMSLYEMEDKFDLQLITWVGLSVSLVCLFLCILTFSLIRSIKSTRTTIHLHLSISLFVATFIFLTCISRTENKVGCAAIASLLHFFFLAAFCWMCLEGVQLFRMVVLVFNTSFKTLYMMIGGYGVPAAIVAVSLLVNPNEYGTSRHCWLSPKLIWSFYGPVCVILVINIFFFLVTVWKLAQKFTTLNPDLEKLQKIKAFTITAVAQLCVLGITWIFGCFQFDDRTMIMSYLFTVCGSLQGVMMFAFHCLFSKQVREEYGNILSRCCAPSKKSYSEFSSLSGKPQASKSTQDTGESHI